MIGKLGFWNEDDLDLLCLIKDIKDMDSDNRKGLLLSAKQSGMTKRLVEWIKKENPDSARHIMAAYQIMRGID